jgi:hypothetical protein
MSVIPEQVLELIVGLTHESLKLSLFVAFKTEIPTLLNCFSTHIDIESQIRFYQTLVWGHAPIEVQTLKLRKWSKEESLDSEMLKSCIEVVELKFQFG